MTSYNKIQVKIRYQFLGIKLANKDYNTQSWQCAEIKVMSKLGECAKLYTTLSGNFVLRIKPLT